MSNDAITPLNPDIEKCIYAIRGKRVMLDSDLADLYGVSTGNLNKAVSRNRERFPEDFMFQLEKEEYDLIFQNGRSSYHGGRRSLPFAFTQEGVSMLSGVLRSERAVQMNVAIMRAFVRLREMALSYKELTSKINDLESKYDEQFKLVFEALRQLMSSPDTPRKELGFHAVIKKTRKK